MESAAYILSVIALSAFATFMTRALPFVALKKHANHELLLFISKFLPAVLMVLLLIYSLKPVWSLGENSWESLLSLMLVAILHLPWRNALISILSGPCL